MEWINVEDRLPENHHGLVLVYCPRYEFRKIDTRHWIGEDYSHVGGEWDNNGNERDEDITHWSYLPQKPME